LGVRFLMLDAYNDAWINAVSCPFAHRSFSS
jgi:hypothetical protein